MTDLDSSSYTTLKTVDSHNGQIHLGVQLLYGLTIGIASTMLLGTLLVAFCDKINCRYLIYFSCFLLFFIGVLGFALCVLFSIMVPTIYFGCQFVDVSLSSSAGFNCNSFITQPISALSSLTVQSVTTYPPVCPLLLEIWWLPLEEEQSTLCKIYQPV